MVRNDHPQANLGALCDELLLNILEYLSLTGASLWPFSVLCRVLNCVSQTRLYEQVDFRNRNSTLRIVRTIGKRPGLAELTKSRTFADIVVRILKYRPRLTIEDLSRYDGLNNELASEATQMMEQFEVHPDPNAFYSFGKIVFGLLVYRSPNLQHCSITASGHDILSYQLRTLYIIPKMPGLKCSLEYLNK
jgi:hypothetical protein